MDEFMELDLDGAADGAGSLERVLKRLASAVAGAFAIGKLSEYLGQAARAGGELEKELLVLRMALGKLKAAIGRAVAPIGEVFIPMLSSAVFAVIRGVKWVGQIIAALFGGSEGMDAMAQSSDAAASAVSGVGKAIKRSLAGFDQLERLDRNTGGSGGSASASTEALVKNYGNQLDIWQRMIVGKIESLIKPLRDIDFTPAIRAFEALKAAIAPIGRALFAGLEWAWHNLLVPLAAWTAEKVLPAFLELLASAAEVLGSVITAARPVFTWLWENFLQPIAQWTGGIVLSVLEALRERLQGVSAWISENQGAVQTMTKVAAAFLAVWAGGQVAAWLREASPLSGFLGGIIGSVTSLTGLLGLLGTDFLGLPQAAGTALAGIREALNSGIAWIKSSFLNPLSAGVKSCVNGVIGFINGLLTAAVSGLNALIRGINSISVTVPGWVPGYGGKSLGFHLKTVTAPQIPYLAQGAVLPANKPFLAVVGDQKHGTNVEAPLETIQQAVAAVLAEQMSGMMAGFSAVVQAIREKEGSVVIGDDVIYAAGQRYGQKLAVAKGGY